MQQYGRINATPLRLSLCGSIISEGDGEEPESLFGSTLYCVAATREKNLLHCGHDRSNSGQVVSSLLRKPSERKPARLTAPRVDVVTFRHAVGACLRRSSLLQANDLRRNESHWDSNQQVADYNA